MGDIAHWLTIKEYTLWLVSGNVDESVMEIEFMTSSGDKTLVKTEVTYAHIKLPEYLKEQNTVNHKNGVSNRSRLFFEGLNILEQKQREMIAARVKNQCS